MAWFKKRAARQAATATETDPVAGQTPPVRRRRLRRLVAALSLVQLIPGKKHFFPRIGKLLGFFAVYHHHLYGFLFTLPIFLPSDFIYQSICPCFIQLYLFTVCRYFLNLFLIVGNSL